MSSQAEKFFAPTERMIATKRRQLLAAAVVYVRDGKDGTMRDRLRTASDASGVSIRELEIEVGNLEPVKAMGATPKETT